MKAFIALLLCFIVAHSFLVPTTLNFRRLNRRSTPLSRSRTIECGSQIITQVPPITLSAPQLPGLNSMRTTSPLTPEENVMHEKCVAGEITPEPIEPFDFNTLIEDETVGSEDSPNAALSTADPDEHSESDTQPSKEAYHSEKLQKEPQMQKHLSAQDTNKLRVLYRWSTANPSVVVDVIKLWAHKFSNKGIGMRAADTASGAIIRFDAMDSSSEIQVHLDASVEPDGSVRVTSRLAGPTDTVSIESAGDFVSRAVSHIDDSLAKDLAEVVVTGESISPTQTASPIAQDSRAEIEKAMTELREVDKHLQWVDPDERPESDTELSEEEADPSDKVEIARRRDPVVLNKAAKAGVRLEKFENKGLEDAAMKELKAMLHNSRKEGFVQVIKSYGHENTTKEKSVIQPTPRSAYAVAAGLEGRNTPQEASPSEGEDSLQELFRAGERMSSLSLADIMNRPTLGETPDQLRGPTPTMPIHLPGRPISSGDGLDIFQSPAELQATLTGVPAPHKIPLDPSSIAGQQEIAKNLDHDRPPDVLNYELDNQRLNALIGALNETMPEMQDMVIDSYRDLMLSENIMFLLRRAQETTDDMKVRLFFKRIAEKTASLVTELSIIVKTESARHLETIQEVCRITAEYQHDDEQYLDKMESMKPYFDLDLLAFLVHAIGEEMTKMRKQGVDPTLAPNSWLQVLTIMRRGVEAEYQTRYEHLIESILMVVRFDRPGDDKVRSLIFQRFVEITPTMELPFLRQLAINMIDNIMARHAVETGLSPSEPFFAASRTEHPMDPQELRVLVQQMKNLKKDVDMHLSEKYVRKKLEEWQEEEKQRGVTIHVRHRNHVRQHAMETAAFIHQREMKKMGMKTDEEKAQAPLMVGDLSGSLV